MTRNLLELSDAEAQKLKIDLEAYNSALRAQGHLGFWALVGLMSIGRFTMRILEDTFLYYPIVLVAFAILLNLVFTKLLPIRWRILKPTYKTKFIKKWGMKPYQARQILAERNGPDVLDGLAADNIRRQAEDKARRKNRSLVNKYRQSQLKKH